MRRNIRIALPAPFFSNNRAIRWPYNWNSLHFPTIHHFKLVFDIIMPKECSFESILIRRSLKAYQCNLNVKKCPSIRKIILTSICHYLQENIRRKYSDDEDICSNAYSVWNGSIFQMNIFPELKSVNQYIRANALLFSMAIRTFCTNHNMVLYSKGILSIFRQWSPLHKISDLRALHFKLYVKNLIFDSIALDYYMNREKWSSNGKRFSSSNVWFQQDSLTQGYSREWPAEKCHLSH